MTPRTYQRRIRKKRLQVEGASPGTKRKKRKEFVWDVAELMRAHFDELRRETGRAG